MATYRGTVAVPVEITTFEPLTEDAVREIFGRVHSIEASINNDARVLGARMLHEASVSIDEAWCASMTRRNTGDGHLYQCSMHRDDGIHGSVEACARNGAPCEEPAEHHDYVSPGWDSPIDSSATAVPA